MEGSAYISSPAFYNEENDRLHFKVLAGKGATSVAEIRRCIETCLQQELEAEFDTQYRIYKVLKENYTIADFC